MPIQVLADVILPNSVVAAGVRGKNMRRNTRSVNQGGYASINADWSRSLREYELGIVPMMREQWQMLEGLHDVTEGGALGFLMQDPKDSTCGVLEGALQPLNSLGRSVGDIGVGYGVPVYQLNKRYAAMGTTRTSTRNITRPMAGLIAKRIAATIIQGASPGNAAFDFDAGRITFVADTSQTVTSYTVGSTTVVNFSASTPMVAAMAVGGRLYITGAAGTGAARINNASHSVTAKAGNTLTIDANTTGLTLTGGVCFKYPQPTEALTWSGGFYTPVHFMNDDLDWDMVRSGDYDTRLLAGPSVVLQEVRE